MITNAILFFIIPIAWAMVSLMSVFPDVTTPDFIVNSIYFINNTISFVSVFIPFPVLITFFSIILLFETSYKIWQGINWLIRKIPFIS